MHDLYGILRINLYRKSVNSESINDIWTDRSFDTYQQQ